MNNIKELKQEGWTNWFHQKKKKNQSDQFCTVTTWNDSSVLNEFKYEIAELLIMICNLFLKTASVPEK